MRVLGLDVGSRTIGIAMSDEARMLASAVETWRRQGQGPDAKEILNRARMHAVNQVVVGWPLELDGSVGVRARRVQAFVDALRAESDAQGQALEVLLWDERFSTAAAERTLLEADLSRAKRKAKIDAVAAQHILQGWLDAEANRADEAKEGRA